MEVDIGAHCGLRNCKQIDFLPFTCDLCRGTYCLEHRTPDAHHCVHAAERQRRVAECPLCGQTLAYAAAAGEDAINLVVEEHINRGCPKVSSRPESIKATCSHARCGEALYVPIKCAGCAQPFCVKHRLPSDHTCPSLDVDPAVARRAATVAATHNVPLLGSGRKLGGSAVGRPPTSSSAAAPLSSAAAAPSRSVGTSGDAQVNEFNYRLDFANNRYNPHMAAPNATAEDKFLAAVIFPAGSNARPQVVQFAKGWTVGRALDVVARLGKIKNENNKPGAPRLYMFNGENGGVLANNFRLDETGMSARGAYVVLEYDVDAVPEEAIASLASAWQRAGFMPAPPGKGGLLRAAADASSSALSRR